MDDEERIITDLFYLYLKNSLHPEHALERLAIVLARDPTMFTQMIGTMNGLGERYAIGNWTRHYDM